MTKGFVFSTDAIIGLAAVMICTVILTFPYSTEEGSETNIAFIKQELPSKAITGFYQGKNALEIGLKPDNSDFNNFDYADCFVLYDYNYSLGVYGKGNIIEKKYCMGKRSLR